MTVNTESSAPQAALDAPWTVDVDKHLDAAYDESYLPLARATFSPAVNSQNAELIWVIGGLEHGSRVLDAPCGFGRVSLELARRGAAMTGIDRSEAMIGEARRQASDAGAEVDYRVADLRALDVGDGFDVALCWGLSFGYFDDPTNRQVLDRLRAAVRPGGRLILDTLNAAALFADFHNAVSSVFFPRGSIFLPAAVDDEISIDDMVLDREGTRLISRRMVKRNDGDQSMIHTMRLFGAAELRSWLTEAGFGSVSFFDEFGRPFSWRARHLVAVAE